MRGRKPEPTNLKLARGIEPRGRKAEPKLAPVAPPTPELLDTEAAAKWRELSPKLEKMGVLTAADSDALCLLCQSWSLAQQARRDIDAEGMVIDGKRNPSLLTWRENVALFTRLSALFGLNPSDRARVSGPPTDDLSDDPMELLLRRTEAGAFGRKWE